MFDKLIDVIRSLGVAILPFQIVSEDRAAILLRFGRFRNVVRPGLLWKFPFADAVMSCDCRSHFYRTDEQSLITLDGEAVVVSCLMSFRVACPKKAILSQTSFGQSVWDGTAATLSRLVSETEFDGLKTDAFAAELMQRVVSENSEYGAEILTCRLENLARARTYRIVK